MTQTPPRPPVTQNGHGTAKPMAMMNGKGRPVPPPPPLKRPPSPAPIVDVATEPDSPAPKRQRIPSLRGWWQGLKLRSKTALGAVALGTLPILVVGGIELFLTEQATIHDELEEHGEQAVSLQNKVNAFMVERYGDIQVLSRLEVFADPRLRNTHSIQQKAEVLERYKESYGGIYDSIAVFDLQGNPIAQTAEGGKLGNHLNRPYIQAALAANGPVVGQPAISQSTGTFSIYTASVIKDEITGQPIGLVRARIPVSVLGKLLETFQGEGKSYYLTNGAHEVFLGSDGEYTTALTSSGQVATAETTVAAVPIQDILPDLALAAANAGADAAPEAMLTENLKTETSQLAAVAPPTTYEGLPPLGWTAYLTQEESVALADLRRLLLALVLGAAGTAVVVTVLALLVARRFSQPLESATQAVAKIGQGDLTVRLASQGTDELAQLNNNINQMAGQLEQFAREQALAAQQAKLLASVTAIETGWSEEKRDEKIIQILEGTRNILHMDRLIIYRFNPNWTGYVSHEAVGDNTPSIMNAMVQDRCIPQDLLDAYARGERVSVMDDVRLFKLHPDHQDFLERLQIKSSVVIPIANQNRLFGFLAAHQCHRPYTWQESEVNLLRDLGQKLGVLLIVREFATLAAEQQALKEGLQRRALELMMQVDPVSHGDLTVRAQVTEDEIGTVADSYNATIESLRRIVSQVQSVAGQVTTTASESETLVQALSDGSTQQTTEIEVALNRLQEMVNSVQLVASNAEQAEQAMHLAAQTVSAGDVAMNRTVDSIQSIRETVAETAKKVKRLGESSQRISKVVNLIGDFASQTNLLALNASIEAARAGEQGRGFAVVADEVRSLARKSTDATSEIEQLVAEIQAETNAVVAAMEEGTEQVVAGTQLVDATRQSLNQITQASDQINALVTAIAQASTAQSQDSALVTQTMKEVAAIAQRNSTEATQVSAAFRDLLAVAQSLQTTVGRFKVS